MADWNRLSLLIQRILDAEVLSSAEVTPLLDASEAARHALAAGDGATAQQHITQVKRLVNALVETKALEMTDGIAIIQAADGMLAAKNTPINTSIAPSQS